MSGKAFKNPPLVEAILEVRWELKGSTSIGKYDPHYPFLLGVFHDKIQSEYSFHEELPASKVPDEVTGSVVKHRFRVGEKDWPLIQIGPGVMTVNETKKYGTFDSFKPKAIDAMKCLFDSYPEKGELNIISLKLRYLNAYEFDYSKQKVQEFISDKMHIQSDIPSFFKIGGRIEELPVNYSLRTSLRCNDPGGTVLLFVDTGHHYGNRAIIWNHMLESTDADVPDMPDGFGEWLQQAHDVIHIGFDGIIDGYLAEEFNK